MKEPLRVLIAEDNPADAELVLLELRRAGFDPRSERVDSESEFVSRLNPDLDLILSDFDMPQFNGSRALELLQQQGLDLPFIVVSGTISDDVAVNVMKQGASDYLLKDRLSRLGPAVRQALDKARLRREGRRDAEALAKSEKSLHELTIELGIERARLVAAQAVAKVGSWDTDLSTMIVIWSAETHRIFETDPERFKPRHEDFLRLVHPDDRAAVDLAFTASLTETLPRSIIHRIAVPGDRIKFVEERWQTFQDAHGKPVRALGTCQDVTERHQADQALRASLQEREALLKEVHHRVKNNLQVITSLLRLEGGRTAEPTARTVLKEMQGRILSMAALHEMLYRTGNFASVDLAGYLSQLATQVFRTHNVAPGNVTLSLDLTPVQLEIDQAIPCGLIVNELISNSLRHGFMDARTGEIRLSLKRDGDQVRLEVVDDGAGLAGDFQGRRGKSLGLQLVNDLARQLGGGLEVGPGPAATFTVTFPFGAGTRTSETRRPLRVGPAA